ncbi:hypothetical protein BLNAU_23725 [Blattamonas nauphoetae]|uniref:Uncharacterized protein n=1 Tax=Blattamonas nauphoetae TaxID=2049346 RepID=A0ABQ9WPW7_9EUKA|nr:hypothetical protein BLNAU_23725 [Blattamonas nauphoetae]
MIYPDFHPAPLYRQIKRRSGDSNDIVITKRKQSHSENILCTLITSTARIPLDFLLATLHQVPAPPSKLSTLVSLSTFTPLSVRDGLQTRSVNMLIPALHILHGIDEREGRRQSPPTLKIMLKVVNVADSSIRGKNVYTEDPVVDWVNHVFNMTEVRNSECTEPRGID